MARPQAFDRELRLATAGLDPDAIVRLLAQTAHKALAEVQANGAAPARYTRIVNGRVGAPEESVIPPGPILYEFSWLPEIVEFALAFAIERSPVGGPPDDEHPGLFKNSWFVLVNGAVAGDLAAIPPDAEVIVTNDRPYARKIEVGAMTMRVPPGIIEDTRQAVFRRFGNIITAEKRFISLAGAYILAGRRPLRLAAQDRRSSAFRAGRTHLAARKDTARGQELRYPALVLRQRD